MTGAALGVILAITLLLLAVVVLNGVVAFWPAPLALFELRDGQRLLAKEVGAEVDSAAGSRRIKLKVANQEQSG